MNNNEKIENYKQEIRIKQNIALLIESTKVLGIYRNTTDFTPFELTDAHGYIFDVAKKTFLNLFDDLRSVLIEKGFIINLTNNDVDIPTEDLKVLKETNPVVNKSIDDFYQNMSVSFQYIQHRTDTKAVNLISLLLENGQIEQVIELIVSEDVPNELKKDILQNIISNYPKLLVKMPDIIPSSYFYYDGKSNFKERFEKILNQNLKEVLNDSYYIGKIIRTQINSEYTDEQTRFMVKGVIEFFVKHNLVDINDINWRYNGTVVSSAAAGYISGNYYLGNYLYSLESYKQTEPTIRLNSDKVILEKLLQRNNMAFDEFIKNKNYESTPEKLNYLMEVLLKIQPVNSDIITRERLDEIINILLRKTKKQDYKAMQQAIYDIKINTDINLLNDLRQELASKLNIVSSSLLDQYPATKIINELNLKPKTK